MTADNHTSVTWGVVWRLGRERRLRLIITEVPAKISAAGVRAALTAAGYKAVFAEGGTAWANHQILLEQRWPAKVTTAAATGRVTWEQLQGRQRGRKLSIELAPDEYASLVLAAAQAGEQLYPWCRRQLVTAAT